MTPRRLKDILWVFTFLGLAAVVLRITTGLGASTDLSDGVPWGLWKVVNMIGGVALATGGFAMAFAGHVLGIRSLKPLVRPAILVAFLGYGASCFALLMDIGLPHRFWHPFVYWNLHSFLFEVFWCVILYFTVTTLEMTPVALEGSRFGKVLAFVKKIATPVMIFGVAFSCMHHTSLGSLFLVSPTRLHELWYSPWLPVHFILSAVGAGLMTVVLVTLVVGHLYRRTVPTELLGKVGAAAAIILGGHLVARFADLLARGSLGSALDGSMEATLFFVEILATVAAVALLATKSIRRSTRGLAAAGLLAILGLVMNRANVGIFGYLSSAGATYHPTLPEIFLALGLPAMAGLVFLYFVEHFRIFDLGEPVEVPATCATVCSFERQTNVWTGVFADPFQRISLLVVIVVPLAVALLSASAGGGAAASIEVRAPLAADATRAVLKIDGNRNGDLVRFEHDDHKRRLGDEASCVLCHHLDLPGDHATTCSRCHRDMEAERSIFDHERHTALVAAREGFGGPVAGNRSCAVCHAEDAPRSRASSRSCRSCHEKDMRMPEPDGRRQDLAPGYRTALHASCVGCHREKAEAAGRPDLPECRTCHPD